MNVKKIIIRAINFVLDIMKREDDEEAFIECVHDQWQDVPPLIEECVLTIQAKNKLSISINHVLTQFATLKNKTFLLSYANDSTSLYNEEFENDLIGGYWWLFNNVEEISAYGPSPPHKRRSRSWRMRAGEHPDIHTHPGASPGRMTSLWMSQKTSTVETPLPKNA